MSARIITTDDGSRSIYLPELDEVYHSKNGALAESKHVFLEAGLRQLMPMQESIRILEVGFGTGLNALLTAVDAHNKSLRVEYLAAEPLPLEGTLMDQLNYGALLPAPGSMCWANIRQYQAGTWTQVHQNFRLKVIAEKIESIHLGESSFHLVYFDAFAPSVQPELWTPEIFLKLYETLKPGGLLVTYSAKGSVRRAMMAAGFEVERLPGPRGKREMLRARKSTNAQSERIRS